MDSINDNTIIIRLHNKVITNTTNPFKPPQPHLINILKIAVIFLTSIFKRDKTYRNSNAYQSKTRPRGHESGKYLGTRITMLIVIAH